MPSQVVYQTNADWHASYEALVNNSLVRADATQKGLIHFWFKESPTLFMLSPTGKMQVKWEDIEEKRILFKLVKNLLVATSNEKLVIKPLKQQIWIDYPVPNSFKVYWCSEASEYALKKPVIRISDEDIDKLLQIESETDKVKKALSELRHEFRFFREPTFNEIVLKSGISHESWLKYQLDFFGWKAESQEYAKGICEYALNLAAWLSYRMKDEQNIPLMARCKKAVDSADLITLKKAQFILKKYPDLVPKVGLNQLIWPDQTRAKWIQVFADGPPPPQAWT